MNAEDFLDAPSADEFLGADAPAKPKRQPVGRGNAYRPPAAPRMESVLQQPESGFADAPDPRENARALFNALQTNPDLARSPMYQAGAAVLQDAASPEPTPVERTMVRNRAGQLNRQQRQREIAAAREETDRAYGDNPLAQAAAAPGRRLASGVAQVVGGVASLPQLFGSDLGRETAEAAEIMAGANMPENPGIADEVLAGAGQILPMIGGASAIRAAALPFVGDAAATGVATALSGAAGGAMTGGEVLRDLRDRPDLGDEEVQRRALAAAVFSGLTSKYADRFLIPGADKAASGVLQAGGRAFLAEGAQEGLDQIGQNIATDRDIAEGVARAALVGGLVGGGARVSTEVGSDANQLAQAIEADADAFTGQPPATFAPQAREAGPLPVRQPAAPSAEEFLAEPEPAAAPVAPAPEAPPAPAVAPEPEVTPELQQRLLERGWKPPEAPDAVPRETAAAPAPDPVAEEARPPVQPAAPRDGAARADGVQPGQPESELTPDAAPDLVLQDMERLYQQDVKDSIRERLGLARPVEQAEQKNTGFLRFLRENGVSSELAQDIYGDNAGKANRALPGVFRKTGLQLDDLVVRAVERGFLTQADVESALDNGGTNKLVELIQNQIRGKAPISAEMAGDAAATEGARRARMELEQQASAIGFDITGMDEPKIAAALKRIERRRQQASARQQQFDAREEARMERQAVEDEEAFTAEQLDALDVPWLEDGNVSERDAMMALGFDPEEIDRYAPRQAEDRRGGEAPDGTAARTAPRAGAADEGSQGRPALESYSPDEVVGRQERAAAAERDEQRQRTEDDNRARADAQRGDFGLTGSDRAADASPDQNDLFSRGGADIEPAESTAETMRAELRSRFGDLADRLERRGILKVWDSIDAYNEAGQASRLPADARGVQGMYSGGVAHLFGDGIEPGRAVGVFLHEVGEHASMKAMLGERYKDLVRRAYRLVSDGDEIAETAMERIPEDTPDKFYDSELLAYMIEETANREQQASPAARSWLRDIVAAIRAWFFQTGFAQKLERFGVRVDLTPKDIAALAVRAAEWQAQQEGTAQRGTTEVMASRKDVAGNQSGDPAGDITEGDYRGQHQAPGRDDGAPAHDLTGNQIYPDDIYSPNGLRYYGTGSNLDAEAYSTLTALRGRPNRSVTIYRAVPHAETEVEELSRLERETAQYMARRVLPKGFGGRSGFEGEGEWFEQAATRRDELRAKAADGTIGTGKRLTINTGDWVTISRKYAQEHGEGALNGKFKIVSKTVRAKDIYTAGDSFLEWGYDPQNEPAASGGSDVQFSKRQPFSATGSNPNAGQLFGPQPWTVPEPGTWDNIVRTLQNNKIDLKRVRDSIEQRFGRLPDAKDAYLQEELYHSKVAARVEKLHTDYIEPILRKIVVAGKNAGVTLDDVNRYLHARHAPERNAAMAAINPTMPNNQALSGMSDADAAKVMADFGRAGKTPALQAIAKDIDQLLADTRTNLVADGLEEAGVVQAWEQAYKHYVPLMRDIEDRPAKGSGFSVKGPEAKRAVGSNRQVVDILANIVTQAETAAIRAEKAEVGRALLAMAQQYPNADFWKVDTPPSKPRINPNTGLVERSAVDPLYQTADNVVMVKDYGATRFIVFNKGNERAMQTAKAMKNLDIQQLPRALRYVGSATRFMASLLTQRNPEFWFTNLARDLQGTAIQMSGTDAEGLQAKVFANVPKAMAGMRHVARGTGKNTQWARYAQELKDAGGTTGYMQIFDNSTERMENLQKEVDRMGQGKADPRRLARGLIEFIDDYNEIIENGVRLAVFQAARDAGVSTERAASIAKNITVNFNRKGNASPWINSLYMFFNAGIQGTARLSQAITTSNKARAVVGGLAGVAFVMDIVNRALAGEDDETKRNRYDLINEFEKSRNWIIMGPDGNYVKVPLPLGFHIFHNAGRLLADALNRKDPRNAAEYGWAFASTVLDAFNPLGNVASVGQLLSPSVLDPAVQLAENKNFMGGKVYKSDDAGFGRIDPRPAYQRYFETTPDFWKQASKQLNDVTGGDKVKPGAVNIEPDVLRHIYGAITGGPGRALDKAVDTAQATARGEKITPQRYPFAHRFMGQINDRQRDSAYFEDLKRAARAKEQFDYFVKNGRRQEALEVLKELGEGDVARGRRVINEFELAKKDERLINRRLRQLQEAESDNEATQVQTQALKEQRAKVRRRVLSATTEDDEE